MELNKKNRVIIEAYNKGYKINKEGNIINPKGKLLRGFTQEYKGYVCKYLNLRFENGFCTFSIHRLQAYQKFGESMFKRGMEVRHLNGDSLDNSWENIGIGTHSQNMMDISKEKRIRNASNPKYNHTKIIKDRSSGMTYKEIMDKHGIKSKGTVSHIINKSIKSKFL